MEKKFINIEKLNKKLQNEIEELKKDYKVLCSENISLIREIKQLNFKLEYYKNLCDNFICENSTLREINSNLSSDLPF